MRESEIWKKQRILFIARSFEVCIYCVCVVNFLVKVLDLNRFKLSSKNCANLQIKTIRHSINPSTSRDNKQQTVICMSMFILFSRNSHWIVWHAVCNFTIFPHVAYNSIKISQAYKDNVKCSQWSILEVFAFTNYELIKTIINLYTLRFILISFK